MIFLKRLFKFYINSSLHVACSVLALAHLTLLRLGGSGSFSFLCTVFFAAIFGYNFVKYFGLAKFHYRSLTTKLKEIQTLSILCLIGFIFCFLMIKNSLKLSLLVLGLITFFYGMPLKCVSSKSLRRITGLKIYVIAFVWAVTTSFLPQLENGLELADIHYIWIFERFIFILVLMLPFEIRDMYFDDLKLSTIPQRIGLYNTKILGYFGVFLLFVFISQNTNTVAFISSSLTLLFLLLFLTKSRPDRSVYFTAFWVESLPIIWWIMWFVLDKLK